MIGGCCWLVFLVCARHTFNPTYTCAPSVIDLCGYGDMKVCALVLCWSSLLRFFTHTHNSHWMYFFILMIKTTFNNGSLGSRIDEERSELRYVMWIAEFSESSNLWTHLALFGIPKSMPVWVSWISQIQWFLLIIVFGLGSLSAQVDSS